MKMDGIKKGDRRIFTIRLMWILSVFMTVCLSASASQAEEVNRSWKTKSVITKLQGVPIPESPGRMIGYFERQGEFSTEVGGKAKQIMRCTFDMIRGVGTYQGYSLVTYPNGSTILAKLKGVMEKSEPGKLPTGHGSGEYIFGTGQFRGIQGKLSYTVQTLKPYNPYSEDEDNGLAVADHTATYTLPDQ